MLPPLPITLVSQYQDKAYYEHEPQTQAWLLKNVLHNWVCVDCGADVGYYTILLSRLAYTGCVHAFESWMIIGMLKENLDANLRGYRHPKLWVMSVGNRTGRLTLDVCPVRGEPVEERRLPFITLDAFFGNHGPRKLQQPDFIRFGTPELVYEALRGAEKLLASCNPYVLFSLDRPALKTRGRTVGEVMTWLYARGYTHAVRLDKENLIIKREAKAADVAAGVDGASVVVLSDLQ